MYLLIFVIAILLILFMNNNNENFCDYYCYKSCEDLAEVIKRNPKQYNIIRKQQYNHKL